METLRWVVIDGGVRNVEIGSVYCCHQNCTFYSGFCSTPPAPRQMHHTTGTTVKPRSPTRKHVRRCTERESESEPESESIRPRVILAEP